LRHLPEHLSARDGLILPGVAELLEALAARDDVLLGLLTGNFREGARLKLGHYSLFHHFELGGFGDNHHDRDDVAREAIEHVHARLDGSVDLERVWVIGDTPADVRCGRAVGAKIVAVATGTYAHEDLAATDPDHLFEDFEDVESLLSVFFSS
jgi:phosphoglycolate phosphatase-like HAD superfamily hydrolase